MRNPPENETLHPARGGVWSAEERYLHTLRPLAGRKNRAAAKIIFATALGVAWRKLKSPEFRRGDENRPQPRILASARLNGMHPPLGPMPGIFPCTCVLPKAWGIAVSFAFSQAGECLASRRHHTDHICYRPQPPQYHRISDLPYARFLH